MTSGNLFPAALLVLFLATRVDFLGVQSTSIEHLSDAFESGLYLRGLAEDTRSSLLRFADRADFAIECVRIRILNFKDHVSPIAAALLDKAADIVDRDAAGGSPLG